MAECDYIQLFNVNQFIKGVTNTVFCWGTKHNSNGNYSKNYKYAIRIYKC